MPLYWYRKPLALQRTAGMHRFLWDMRYQPLEVGGGRGRGGLPISATPYNTVPAPNSIWAPPGLYTVKLTVDGRTFEQPLTLRLDPRVKTPAADLAQLTEMSLALYDGILEAQKTLQELRSLRGRMRIAKDEAVKAGRPAEVLQALDAVDKEAADLEGGMAGPGGAGGGPGGPMRGPTGTGGPTGAGPQDTLTNIAGSLNSLMSTLQASDTTPTSQLSAAVAERLKALQILLGKMQALKAKVK